MALKEELIQFIHDNLIEDGEGAVDESEDLIDRGLVDSIGLIQIMNFVEDRAGVRIPDDEVTPDNFQTVQLIEQMVARLRNGHG